MVARFIAMMLLLAGLWSCRGPDRPSGPGPDRPEAPAAQIDAAATARVEPGSNPALQLGRYRVTSATLGTTACDVEGGERMRSPPATLKLETHTGIWLMLVVSTCDADDACVPYVTFRQHEGGWMFDSRYDAIARPGSGHCDIHRTSATLQSTNAGLRMTWTLEKVGSDLIQKACREIRLKDTFESLAAHASCVEHRVIAATRE